MPTTIVLHFNDIYRTKINLYDDKTENLVSNIVIDRSEIGDKEWKFFNSDGKLI